VADTANARTLLVNKHLSANYVWRNDARCVRRRTGAQEMCICNGFALPANILIVPHCRVATISMAA
jgi:hypothetical protein